MKFPLVPSFGRILRAPRGLLAILAGSTVILGGAFAAAPATPEIISILDTSADGSNPAAKPQLKWTAVADPGGGTPKYLIYRDGDASPIATITDGSLSYTDTTLPDPDANDALLDSRHMTFSYNVSAMNSVTNEESAQSATAYYGFRRAPFILKWNDDRYSPATDFRATSWPGGATEPPRVTIGNDGVGFTANGQTVRFWGINFAYGANIPSKADAPLIAARLAQFGVNLVRIHNIDAYTSETVGSDLGPHGILKNPAAAFTGASDVSTDALDKFDYFIGELRKNFIYVDLNLRVGKIYPNPDDSTKPARYKGIDLYYADYIAEQKTYASFLLNHTNPYAPKAGGGNHTYATDPAIAIVEINNEDGLISNWWGGAFDGALASAHSTSLATKWNDWLAAKYGSGTPGTSALAVAWAPKTAAADFPAATELLTSGDFSSGYTNPPWLLQVYSPATVASNPPAVLSTAGPTGQPALSISVTTADSALWHVQLLYGNVAADTTKPHTLRFHARTGAAETTTRKIRVGWRKRSNYTVLHDTEVELTNTWREFIVVLPARGTSDGPVDVFFTDLARQTGDILLSSVSLQVGNAVASGTSFVVESSTTGADLVSNGQFPNTDSIAANTNWSVTDTDSRLQPFLGATSVVAAGGDGGGTGNNAVTIEVSGANEASGIYLRRTGLSYVAGRTYEITFHAKHSVNATAANKISVNGRNSSTIFNSATFIPTTSWQTFRHVFTAGTTTTNGWIDFHLGNLPSGSNPPATFSLSQVTVTEVPVVGLLAGETMGTVALPKRLDFPKRSRAMQTDWITFLWDTETSYWKDMRDHILSITGTTDRPLVIGTQVDFSPCYLQAQDMDIVDSHSYWQHYNQLPNKILTARNTPMSGTTDGANTVGLRSGRRILNKPFMGTESGHGFPNTYAGEGAPLYAAYAALQGWQGLCMFVYEDHNREEKITGGGYYDAGFEGVWTMGRSPTKMATMPFAAKALSVVAPAPTDQAAIAVVDRATIIEAIRQKQKANLSASDFAGGAISTLLGFTTRVGTRMDASDCYVQRPSTATSGVLTDPSGKLTWDTTAATRRSLITTATAKSFYGYYVPNTSIALGDGVSLSLNDSFQHRTNVGAPSTECWAGVSLTLKEGASFGAAGSRWLVTTAGYTDNYKQSWQTYRGPISHEDTPSAISSPKVTGSTTTFVERISGQLTFNVGSGRLSAYSLDENGDRLAPLAVSYSSPNATVTIPSTTNTMWYEMSVDQPSTALSLSFPASSNGYGAIGTTAIGVADTALAANANTRTTDDAKWTKIGTASDTSSLMVATDAPASGNATGTRSLILSAAPATSGQSIGGWIDLRGQNIPSFKVWELETYMRFTSSTTDTVDDLHLVVGQDPSFPVVHLALSRAIGGSSFKVQLQTAGGMMNSSTNVSSGSWVKVRVRVAPAGADGAPAEGKLELWVNDVAQTLTNNALPSVNALPDELHIYTGPYATGNAWIDEVKIAIP